MSEGARNVRDELKSLRLDRAAAPRRRRTPRFVWGVVIGLLALAGGAQLRQAGDRLIDEVPGSDRRAHGEHVGVEAQVAVVAAARQFALTYDRLALGGDQGKPLNGGGAQAQHHDRVGRVSDIQKIRQQ